MSIRPLGLACLLSICIAAASPGWAQDAPLKIGVLDLDMVISQSEAGQELQAKLEAFGKEAQTESEAMQATAKELQQQITSATGVQTDDEINKLKQQFQDAMIALRRHQDEKNREAQSMRNEGLQAVEKQLQPVFDTFQAEMGYDLIFSKQSGVVLMSADRVDITQQVIDRLK